MTARTLVLLRHAKAETPGELPDFERRLTDRGRNDAGAAGAWLAHQQIRPELVLCSPATRTRQTWQEAAITLTGSRSPEVHYDKGLYHGGRTEVFDLLRAVPDTVGTVLVVGHNPTVSEVSIMLIPNEQWDGQEIGLRTAGLALHRADGPWSQTEPGSMRLIERHTARA